jgi:rubredoxin
MQYEWEYFGTLDCLCTWVIKEEVGDDVPEAEPSTHTPGDSTEATDRVQVGEQGEGKDSSRPAKSFEEILERMGREGEK